MSGTDVMQLLRTKAEAVHATVTDITNLQEAFAYTVDLCDQKEACQLLISGCEEPLSTEADALCEAKTQQKIIAAPGLGKEEFSALGELAKQKGIALINEGMRDHLAGIDVGFTVADGAIANTGTIIQGSNSEELRLATMVSEVHVCVLPTSTIVEDSYHAEELLSRLMSEAAYTAFITGPSRTADIERTLALGAHGPLELHILLLED